MPRVIAIGDVHGCSKELLALLEKLQLTDEDELIFVGDLINRGPDSEGVLRIVRGLKNTQCLLGNHERRFLRYRETGKEEKLKPGDFDTLALLTDEDWVLLESMKPYIYREDLNTIFVHGGFLPGIPWRENTVKTMVRIQVVDKKGRGRKRSQCPDGTPWADLWEGPEFVVYGHTPRMEVYESPHAICIDTACAYGGPLTAYVLPERKIVQV
tara:strand:- start:85919 stop:86554 length:636 start_codon:yes stop_codon:yes gene_type:complete